MGQDRQGQSQLMAQAVSANVRQLRARAGLTLQALADRAGIGKSTLALVESGGGNPSLDTLAALATALGVPVGTLVTTPTATVRLVRAGAGTHLEYADPRMSAELLASTGRRGITEVYWLQADAGGARTADAHVPGTIEHVLVVSGRMRIGPAEAPVELAPGDLLTFHADLPHHYEGLAPESRAVLLLDYA
jgi:transcriptional regulator with XRE-family HTH domain